MDSRLPFYIAYESPFVWDDERLNRRDYEYMKAAYPDTAKKLLPYIEEACDQMEYNGSILYDEYPDQLQIRLMCRRIYSRVNNEDDESKKWMMELIQLMFYHEMCQRRREYRGLKRRYY